VNSHIHIHNGNYAKPHHHYPTNQQTIHAKNYKKIFFNNIQQQGPAAVDPTKPKQVVGLIMFIFHFPFPLISHHHHHQFTFFFNYYFSFS
jgi:hypothetical protein